MKPPTLSSETLHASTVARDSRAVLITGPSGSGKSDLALRLLDRGFKLVSDDQTMIRLDGERLLASPPANISGKLEVRGIGIVELEYVGDVPVALIVALSSEILRMPDQNRAELILGVPIPLVAIDPGPPSAASKVALALDRMGLK